MPYQQRRDKKWRGQVQFKGARHTSQESYPSKAEAKAWEVDKLRLLKAEHAPGSVDLACWEWLERYLEYCEPRMRPRTVAMKTDIATQFLDHDHIDRFAAAKSLRPAACLSYLQDVQKDVSGYEANKHRTHLLAAWNWGHKFLGLPLPAPFAAVEKFPHEPADKYVPTMDDFMTVLNATEGQDKLLLWLYLYTAARRCELYGLAWADVDLSVGKLRLWTYKTKGKGRRGDWVDLVDDLVSLLAAHRRGHPDDLFVFQKPAGLRKKDVGRPYTIRHSWIPILCRKIGVEPFNHHAIRHLTPTYLLSAGIPLPTVQKIMRHSNISITSRYLHSQMPTQAALSVLPKINCADSVQLEEKKAK